MAKLMTLSASGIVVYRALIATVILFAFNKITKAGENITRRDKVYLIFTGMTIGLHWLGFFTAIKVSTVSIGLICISSAPIFVAILQPFVEKTTVSSRQVLLGILSVIGIGIMFKFESQYQLGIIIGLCAGAVDAVYSIMTSKTREGIPSSYMTQLHMFGAFLIVFAIYMVSERGFDWLILENLTDYIGIAFLGVVCSAIAMSLYVRSIKKLSAFTATLSLNMEAVYGILLALIIFGEDEHLSAGFYVGAALLVSSVVIDSLISAKERSTQTEHA